MRISRAELSDSVEKAFSGRELTNDPDFSWQAISEMGWLLMGVPEGRGGLGQGAEARGVIHHGLGRMLVLGPIIAQMMVIDALVGGRQDDQTDALLDAAASGHKMTASLAIGGHPELLEAVPDADLASHVLHIHDEQIRLVPLAECEVRERETWDTTRRLFDVRLGPHPGIVLAECETARALAETVRTNMLIALSADSLGGAEAALAITVDYLGTRRQFDRPLAMFQALKHRCADLRAAISLADALLWQQVSAGVSLVQAGALKSEACRVYKKVAEEAIQLHGGIGLTLEHPCHLFLKRAFLNAALGGDGDYWEEQAGHARINELGRH
jgi:alkylation response protein AidB-like acyl-CoA dehydrogenase